MESRPPTVHIYESEAKRISKCTLRYPNIETGGDLFGLWLNANEIVIQAVLGPGQNCRRTATSFFQDEQYLSKVGASLTQEQGLCNIGSWHSHHTMNLPDPSRGDKDTVWKHLPTPGRFVLLIAAIKTETETPKVQMGFYLFESTVEGNKLTSLNLNILQGESPIRANEAISSKILEGAELHSAYSESAAVQTSLIKPKVNKETIAKRQEVAQPDMNPNSQRDDCSAFFKQSSHQRHRRPPNQNVTCSGVPSSFRFDTFSPSANREIRYPRPHRDLESKRYTVLVTDMSNGRQKLTYYHWDHLLGECRECSDSRPVQRKSDGKIFIEHRQKECNIL